MKLLPLIITSASLAGLTHCAGKHLNSTMASVSDTGGLNHGDLKAREHRLAWFSGVDTIHYCVQIGDDVPLANATQILSKSFEDSFYLWANSDSVKFANRALLAAHAKVIATKVMAQSSCEGAELIVGFGSKFANPVFNDVILGSRESLISAGYALKTRAASGDVQGFLWTAGSSPAPEASGLSVEGNKLRSLDYNRLDEVSATLRYTVGRMFGNIRTPGTLMEQLPEDLIGCAHSNGVDHEACAARIQSTQIESPYQLMTSTAAGGMPVDGCFAGAGPVSLMLNPDSRQVQIKSTDGDQLSINWSNIAGMKPASVQRLEVYAVDTEQRFFFDQLVLSGFANTATDRQDFVRIAINTGTVAATVSLPRCDNGEQVLFTSGKSCPSGKSASLNALFANALKSCL